MSLKQNGKDHHTDNLKVKKNWNKPVCLSFVCLSVHLCLSADPVCVSSPTTDQKQICVPSCVKFYSVSVWVWCCFLPPEWTQQGPRDQTPNTFSVGGHGINYWTKSQADQNAMSHTSPTDKTDFQLQHFSDTLTVMILDHLKVWKLRLNIYLVQMLYSLQRAQVWLWDEQKRSGRKVIQVVWVIQSSPKILYTSCKTSQKGGGIEKCQWDIEHPLKEKKWSSKMTQNRERDRERKREIQQRAKDMQNWQRCKTPEK